MFLCGLTSTTRQNVPDHVPDLSNYSSANFMSFVTVCIITGSILTPRVLALVYGSILTALVYGVATHKKAN